MGSQETHVAGRTGACPRMLSVLSRVTSTVQPQLRIYMHWMYMHYPISERDGEPASPSRTLHPRLTSGLPQTAPPPEHGTPAANGMIKACQYSNTGTA